MLRRLETEKSKRRRGVVSSSEDSEDGSEPSYAGDPGGPSPWDGWLNAELYAEYGDRYLLYRQLNRHLVDRAELGSARRVLDLGCGTGATSSCCLDQLPRDAEISAVDASRSMLSVARARLSDRRVRFYQSPAEDVAGAVSGLFDRVVSNAAFGMFRDPREVFRQLSALTRDGALLVFNLPRDRVAGQATEPHPFQLHLGRALARRGGTASASDPAIDLSEWSGWLAESGFETLGCEPYTLRARQGDLAELMGLPAMLGRTADYLPPVERRAAWQDAVRLTNRELPVEVEWLYVRARRRADGESAAAS